MPRARRSGSNSSGNWWSRSWKLAIAAVAVAGVTLLWVSTHRLDRSGTTPGEQVGVQFMTTEDGRVIPVNVGLPERVIVIERNGEEVTRFTAEITDTPMAQQIGLMGRTELAPDRAMLFTWDPPAVIAMWMKDTLISLDFLYVRADGVVVAIGHNVPPCPPQTARCPAYDAPGPVSHVLEMVGGRARELGLRAGDRLVIGGEL